MGGFASPRKHPSAVAGSGLPATSSHPLHGQGIPKGALKASPDCPGTPPPYLSPDSLFCGEEEEEMVEDLESAEALLAGQTPRQRAVIGSRRWVHTPNHSPLRGWGLASPIFTQPSTHLSFLPARGDFLEDAMGLWPSLDSLHHGGPKEGREALSNLSILWQPVSWSLSICIPPP